jgi:hypothetical protein
MGKLVDAITLKRDKNKNKIRDKMIGQEGVAAVIEEAAGEAPRGGWRQRQHQRLVQAQAIARILHVPMC